MKKNNPEISIVIPCYNSELYISKLLDSIYKQTYKDFEVICVNDGSTDDTLNVIKHYKSKYKYENLYIFSKKNEGGINVTQNGLKHAKGKYICAVDNDDILHKDYLKELYKSITKNNSDIAICGFQRIDYDTKRVISTEMCKKECAFDINTNYGELLEVNTSLWNKMYKKEIILSMLDFRLDSRGLGDMTINSFLYSKINKITYVNRPLYYYQVRKDSNINTMRFDVIDSIYDNLKRIKEYYLKYRPEMCEFIDAYAFLHLGISMMYRLYRNNKKDFKKAYKINITFLDDFFSLWRYNRYYSLKYVFKNKGNPSNAELKNL